MVAFPCRISSFSIFILWGADLGHSEYTGRTYSSHIFWNFKTLSMLEFLQRYSERRAAHPWLFCMYVIQVTCDTMIRHPHYFARQPCGLLCSSSLRHHLIFFLHLASCALFYHYCYDCLPQWSLWDPFSPSCAWLGRVQVFHSCRWFHGDLTVDCVGVSSRNSTRFGVHQWSRSCDNQSYRDWCLCGILFLASSLSTQLFLWTSE